MLSFSCSAGCCRSGKGYGTCSSEGQMWWNGEALGSASINLASVVLHHSSRVHGKRLPSSFLPAAWRRRGHCRGNSICFCISKVQGTTQACYVNSARSYAAAIPLSDCDLSVIVGVARSHPRSPFFCTFSGRGVCNCLGRGPGSNHSQGHLRF